MSCKATSCPCKADAAHTPAAGDVLGLKLTSVRMDGCMCVVMALHSDMLQTFMAPSAMTDGAGRWQSQLYATQHGKAPDDGLS